MEHNDISQALDYNTSRERLAMPEYGRNVLRMVDQLREIPDRAKRTEQAYAVVKVMELLNPQVHSQENYAHKLWDHLYMIAGYDLDVDSPWPFPVAAEVTESIINLICEQPEGEVKTELIRSLAIYMRQQYLIWNKDSVADETIFADIEKLSGGRIQVPEGISLSKIAGDANFSRPGMGINVGQPGSQRNKQRKNFKRSYKKK